MENNRIPESSGELALLLKQDLQARAADSPPDEVLRAMQILAERNGNRLSGGKTPEQAFAAFREHYMPQSVRNSRRWIRRLSAAAAALALAAVFSATAGAFNFNLWGAVANWTRDTFHFGTVNTENDVEPDSRCEGVLFPIQDALSQKELPSSLLPTWLPEGFEQVDITVSETPMSLTFLGMYTSGDRELKIQVKEYLEEDPQLMEKSDSPVECYESGGNTYYLFENRGKQVAVWMKERYECFISGSLTVEELKAVLDSIPQDAP